MKKATSTVKSISYFKSLVNNIRPIIMDNISSSSSTWHRVEIFDTEFKMFCFRCRNFFRNRNRNRKHPKSIFSGNENFLTAKFDLRCFLVPHFHQKTAKFFRKSTFSVKFFGIKMEPELILAFSCFRPDPLRRSVLGLLRPLVRKALRNFRLRRLRRIFQGNDLTLFLLRPR